jgi:murein DD-endopeptidase MepM/ murein hydrolase activator NlpD
MWLVMRRRTAAALAFALVLAGAVAPLDGGSVGAEPSKGERIEALQARIGEASRAEVAALEELEALQSRRAEAEARVADIDAGMRAARERIATAEHAAALLTVAAIELDERADRTQRRLRVAKGQFESSTAALYSNGSDAAAAYTSMVLDASSLVDLGAASVYLENVTTLRKDAVDRLAGLRGRIARLRLDAERHRNEVSEARRVAEQDEVALRAMRGEHQAQRDVLARAEQREQRLVARIRSRKAEYNAQLAALQVTSVEVRSLLYDLQQGQRRASSFSARRPVPGGVTSSFGTRVHPVLGTTRFHAGVDFEAGYGSAIVAAAPGRVVYSGPRGGYGNAVVIDHGGQFATLYGHASELYVDVGERVSAGETVAAAGSTGMATGPHLHFEVRILGNPVDPMQYL